MIDHTMYDAAGGDDCHWARTLIRNTLPNSSANEHVTACQILITYQLIIIHKFFPDYFMKYDAYGHNYHICLMNSQTEKAIIIHYLPDAISEEIRTLVRKTCSSADQYVCHRGLRWLSSLIWGSHKGLSSS